MTTMKKITFIILAVLITTGINAKSKKTYWKNGKVKTEIEYDNEYKLVERTFYENGKWKTNIGYYAGKKFMGPICFKANGKTETCTLAKHGCTKRSKTCIKQK